MFVEGEHYICKIEDCIEIRTLKEKTIGAQYNMAYRYEFCGMKTLYILNIKLYRDMNFVERKLYVCARYKIVYRYALCKKKILF